MFLENAKFYFDRIDWIFAVLQYANQYRTGELRKVVDKIDLLLEIKNVS